MELIDLNKFISEKIFESPSILNTCGINFLQSLLGETFPELSKNYISRVWAYNIWEIYDNITNSSYYVTVMTAIVWMSKRQFFPWLLCFFFISLIYQYLYVFMVEVEKKIVIGKKTLKNSKVSYFGKSKDIWIFWCEFIGLNIYFW